MTIIYIIEAAALAFALWALYDTARDLWKDDVRYLPVTCKCE